MTDPSPADRWQALEPQIRALIQGWRQTLGGPPPDQLTYALVRAYDALDRREAQVAKLQPTVDYSAPLQGTLAGLLAERDELRARVAEIYQRWRAANPG